MDFANTRIVGLGLAIVVTMAVTTAAEATDRELRFTAVDVSPAVVMALHDNGSNITCVVLDEGLVFFDASLSTRTAHQFRREMEARFERPAIALVLTHAHLDHLLGMGAFGDVPVFAAAAGRPRWERFVAIEWDERATQTYASIFPTLPDELPDAALRFPTQWFDEELTLGSGDDAITIHRTGGHTSDSSSVVVGGKPVVIAGDLIQARRRPYFGEPDTDFDAWIDAMRGWEALEVGAVCPGHGPVIDTIELSEIRRWFEEAMAATSKTKKAGATFEEALADPGLPTGYWPDDDPPRWWAYCLKRLYDAS